MTPAELQDLIEKFYAGEASEQEEQKLKAYLRQPQHEMENPIEQLYFSTMDSVLAEQLDDRFDERLMQKLNEGKPKKSSRTLRHTISAVAAAAAILIALWFGTDLLNPKEVYGTIHDPHIAFAKTRQALDEFSKKMNKGLEPTKETVKKIEKNVEKTKQVKKLNEALEKTKSIKKIDEASELLKSFSKVYVDYGKS